MATWIISIHWRNTYKADLVSLIKPGRILWIALSNVIVTNDFAALGSVVLTDLNPSYDCVVTNLSFAPSWVTTWGQA
jgi:hypothetical protein